MVDTAPLMERELARVAGLGWQGKNTLLLNRQWGSWFFLSELLTTATLGYDSPTQTDHLRDVPGSPRRLSDKRFCTTQSARCDPLH